MKRTPIRPRSRQSLLARGRLDICIVVVVVSCVGVLVTCSTREAQQRSPKLRLSLSQHVGEIPFEVTLNGYLDGGRDDDPSFYCLDAEWDFQGRKIRDSVDCDPLEDGNVRIRRAYSTRYTFDQVGNFKVTLTLKQDGQVRAQSSERVNARQSGMGFSGGQRPPVVTTSTVK